MKITIEPGDDERHEDDQDFHRGRHNTGRARRRARRPAQAAFGGGAAGALPAAVGGEDVAQRREARRRRRRAAGSRPSAAARAASRSPRPPRGSPCRRPPWRRPRRPRRAWPRGRTRRRRCRGRPARRTGVGRARPAPTSSRQWGQRSGSSGQSSPTFLLDQQVAMGAVARPPPPSRFLLVADAIRAPVSVFSPRTGRTKPLDGPLGRKCERFGRSNAPSQ